MASALTSLFGQGHTDAGGAKRNQTVLTPPCIIEALLTLWPEGIALDPCAESIAETTGAGAGLATVVNQRHVPAKRHYDGRLCGLEQPWVDRTYCNPPYNQLNAWLTKSSGENVEHVMLVPVRTQRTWFRLELFDAVAFLKPLTFVGYKHVFPAPLCLLYRAGHRFEVHDKFDQRRKNFRAAVAHLSTNVLFL